MRLQKWIINEMILPIEKAKKMNVSAVGAAAQAEAAASAEEKESKVPIICPKTLR